MKRSHRQLLVILNEDVEGLGFKGELVTVRSGFARNYLLPQSLAAVATPKLQQERAKAMAAAEERRTKETTAREELAAKLAEETIELPLKVGPNGQVFGSVTAAVFAKAVKAQRKLDIDPKHLSGLPISVLGPGHVSARLGLGVTVQIPVTIKGVKAAAEKPAATIRKEPASA